MGEDKTSFWTDIKLYEEILERNPDSYAFIPLAKLYRKLGLPDDALAVAKRGTGRHPNLVAGQLELGLACHELGLKGEGRTALEYVARITPENVQAQRILSEIYADAGDSAAAESALRIVLDLAPNDLESRVILDSLARTKGVSDAVAIAETTGSGEFDISGADSFGTNLSGEELFFAEQMPAVATESSELDEEIHELTDDCIIEELEEVAENEWAPNQDESAIGHAPVVSATMAELYVKQGFNDLAIGVYRQLVAQHPMDTDLLVRLNELLSMERNSSEVPHPEVPAPPFVEPSPLPELGVAGVGDDDVQARPAHRRQALVATLEGWLASIGRMKECRSKLH
ncbi:tetratricopeptide repeat protein [Geobacter argillaceus]|uniref:Tetratricopeptide repeat protein n=1 Tax=Geobacter argillaceus TaxID=345631 RepID=A0A562WQZ2_9BACT|nr:tetratricopeptide repeat protein [Geobacter argillaceus]TWJ32773.1 tetratricopeptide repeat protein [Geobacter argillaceus]